MKKNNKSINDSTSTKSKKASNDNDSGIDFKVHRLRFADW